MAKYEDQFDQRPQPKFDADAWIEQEFAKVNPGNAQARYMCEVQMVVWIEDQIDKKEMTRDEVADSHRAHAGLAIRIATEFGATYKQPKVV